MNESQKQAVEQLITAAKTALEECIFNGDGSGDNPKWVEELGRAVEAVEMECNL